ncbi:hypothetical protein GE09DRAFT_683610 [Coniochaeta sp. 2T2.1]|nr:hypothetical protein GE09DRAFT_683610 [Coniochaeta sp. 2T2.1]
MHHSTPSVQNRAVHDFGAKLVENCKADIIAHFTNRDIDDVADQILAKASNAFLDKALEMRLATIDAKPLLNALARAERLGYDSQDLVEVSQGEHVIPHTVNGQTPTGVSRTAGPRAAHPSEPQCLKCFRTFAKKSYFDYHVSRSVCSKIPPTDDGFRYACSKCGQGFTHTGGLSYHLAKNVCEGGADAASEPQQGGLPATPGSVRSTASPAHPAMTQTPSSQPTRTNLAGVMPANRPSDLGAASKGSPIVDPYSHLSKEEMDKLNAELLQAEELYAGRFQEAEAMPEGEAKRARIDSLRNSFGTKQSMIRKRYGVRLRERRTRAEILAEKERMGVRGRAARAGSGSPAPTQQQQHQHQQQTPTSSAWTAANRMVSVDLTADDSTASRKRRRMDEGGGYISPYPPMQTGPTTRVSEMAGGLTASSATGAIHDPTLPPSSTPARTFQQAGARVEIHLPSKPSPSKPSSAAASMSGAPNGNESRDDSRTPDIMDVDNSAAQLQEENTKADRGQEQEQEESDNESDNGNENEVISLEDDSDDDDDEDIPSSLPPNVRQSLNPTPLGPMY